VNSSFVYIYSRLVFLLYLGSIVVVCHHYCEESIESSDTVDVYRGVAKTRPFTTWRCPTEIRIVLPAEELIKDVDGIDRRRVSAQ